MMKEKVRKLLAVVLTIAVCMSNMVIVSAREKAEDIDNLAETDWETVTEEDCDVKIAHSITSHWDQHYNVDVTLENMTDERIDNWEICIPANYEIENIWNAKITDHLDGEYTIHNAECNQDISVNGSVSFGMTVKCSEEVKLPKYAETTGLSEKVDESKYKVEFRKHSQWDDKFTGQIIITNQCEEQLEDWEIFLNSNFEIVQIWNAAIADEVLEEDLNFYDIQNPGYNQNIAPNQSVEFGFIATCKDEPKLSHLELYHVTADFDFSEEENEDGDELEFVDEFRLDSDYFETREEYEQYLEEHGLSDDDLLDLDEPTTFSRSRKSPKKAEALVKCMGQDIGIDERALATQHYMPLPNGTTYLMNATGKNANVVRRTVDSHGNLIFDEPVTFKGFGHGQTFEQFINSSNEEYYLLGGGATKKFARKLAIMPRSLFENEVLNHNDVIFNNWKNRKGLFRIMTGLECANKNGVKRGDLHRADAALTADGSTLVIWKEVQNSNDESFCEISLYNMRKILKIYDKQKKAAQKKKTKNNNSLKLSFAGKRKGALQKACIGSFWEKNEPGKGKSILKPYGSFQSIDIEKYIENGQEKWRIAITSGNEIGELKPVTITRLEVGKSKKKSGNEVGVTYEAFRDRIGWEGEANAKLELEGGHIINASGYNFIALKKTGMIKVDGKRKFLRRQYFATVDLLSIQTRVK